MAKKGRYHNIVAQCDRYDIEELVRAWELGGWQGFSKLIRVPSHKIGWDRTYFAQKSNNIEDKIISGTVDIMQCGSWNANGFVDTIGDLTDEAMEKISIGDAIFALANTPYDKPFNYKKTFPKNKSEKRDCIKKTISAFIDSTTIMEAFLQIASKKTLLSYLKKRYESEFEQMFEYERARRITKKLKKFMEWLLRGLAGGEAYVEAWWNCVWLEMEPDIKKLLDINKKIKADIPVNDKEVVFLNQILDFIKLRANRVVHGEGVIEYNMIASRVSELSRSETESVRCLYGILIPPAFIIVQKLQESFRTHGPRYVVKCRAPSCGKMFYSGRKNALACPNKNGRGMSACLKEWTSYKRWLEKTGRSAEEWDNEEYKDAHHKFYTPYYTGK
jgi:hypothetical protein